PGPGAGAEGQARWSGLRGAAVVPAGGTPTSVPSGAAPAADGSPVRGAGDGGRAPRSPKGQLLRGRLAGRTAGAGRYRIAARLAAEGQRAALAAAELPAEAAEGDGAGRPGLEPVPGMRGVPADGGEPGLPQGGSSSPGTGEGTPGAGTLPGGGLTARGAGQAAALGVQDAVAGMAAPPAGTRPGPGGGAAGWALHPGALTGYAGDRAAGFTEQDAGPGPGGAGPEGNGPLWGTGAAGQQAVDGLAGSQGQLRSHGGLGSGTGWGQGLAHQPGGAGLPAEASQEPGTATGEQALAVAQDNGSREMTGAALSGGSGGGPAGSRAPGGQGPEMSWAAQEGTGADASGKAAFFLQAQPLAPGHWSAPGAPAAARPSVLHQLATHLQEMVAAWRQESAPGGVERVAIRLHPEYLGEVVLRISVDPSGTVTARFTVDNPQVRAWIEQDLPQLRAALAEHGLQLADAGVDSGPGHHSSFAFEAGTGPGGGWSSGHSPPHPGRGDLGHGPGMSGSSGTGVQEAGEPSQAAAVERTTLIDVRA